MEYLRELLSTLNEMSPYLLLGFLISGLLHVYVPRTLYSRFLHRKGFGSVLRAAIIGVPLPLCSCGVIPTAVSLKKEGASDGATVSFLVGTPQTGIDSILATYSLLGLPFAIVRPIAAFLVAVFGGFAVDQFHDKGEAYRSCEKCAKNRNIQKINYSKFNNFSNKGDKNHYSKVDSHNFSCYNPTTIENYPVKKLHSESNCCCSHEGEDKRTIGAALRYGYVYMMQDFGKWLVIGLLIAAAITAFIPASLFAIFKSYYFLNILVILIISAPMYVCATGSIPVALSLIMKGVTPGAAFVLLMAGPATNVASLIILRREIGSKKTTIYLISIIIGAIISALVIDFILPEAWFSNIKTFSHHFATSHIDTSNHQHHHQHEICTHGAIWWQTTASIIFIVLFINAMILKYKHSKIQNPTTH